MGAPGLALFAGSLLGAVYSFVLALVLSHIADAEEEDLRARFGEEYVEYGKRVPKILNNMNVKHKEVVKNVREDRVYSNVPSARR